MAEGVFRSLVKSNPCIGEIDSAGTGAYHELDPPDYRTIQTLRKNGISDYDHAARKIRVEDFEDFDYVLAMDGSNLRDLQRMQRRLEHRGKKTRAQVMMFGDFGGKRKAEEVIDPYYGEDGGFDDVFEQVGRFSKGFLKQVFDRDEKTA